MFRRQTLLRTILESRIGGSRLTQPSKHSSRGYPGRQHSAYMKKERERVEGCTCVLIYLAGLIKCDHLFCPYLIDQNSDT